MNKYLLIALYLTALFCSLASHSAVILQYHHVSNDTPASTSISPLQFEAHMQYLADNGYKVVALSELINNITKQQPLQDNTVAITFDDAYTDILLQAKPILDKFNYPFTVFVNPSLVKSESNYYLSWQQLKSMADQGVIIANHGYNHHSLARIPSDLSEQQWFSQQSELLLKAEQMIEQQTGQSWRYFAYPYGEYTPAVEQWIQQQGFVAFSQQSGAVGLGTSLSSVPRFPASQPYDNFDSLRDKLRSLPLTITLDDTNAQTVHHVNTLPSATFNIIVDDFKPSKLNCYVTGLGRQAIEWQNEHSFTITFSKPLPIGRVRSNCTAPSISQPGRFYWYSKPWFILNEDGSWYPL